MTKRLFIFGLGYSGLEIAQPSLVLGEQALPLDILWALRHRGAQLQPGGGVLFPSCA